MAVENNSTVRWFHSDMAGAPQLTTSPGSIIAILDACLIDGFGAATPDGNKITVSAGVATVEFSNGHDFEEYAVVEIAGATPSALNDVWRVTGATATAFTFDCPGISDGTASGSITVKRATPGYWEKAFGDNLVAAYRSTHPEGTGAYLRIDDSLPFNDTFAVPIRGYSVMTDIDSGQGEFPTFVQRPADNSSSNHNWNRISGDNLSSWTLISDDRFFYFLPCGYLNRGAALYEFGDISAPISMDQSNCVTSGHYRKSSIGYQNTSANSVNNSGALGCHFMAAADGSDPGTAYRKMGGYSGTLLYAVTSETPYPCPISGGYLYQPVMAADGAGQWRGFCPGLFQTLNWLGDGGGLPDGQLRRIMPRNQGYQRAMMHIKYQHQANENNYPIIALDIEGPWR